MQRLENWGDGGERIVLTQGSLRLPPMLYSGYRVKLLKKCLMQEMYEAKTFFLLR